MLKWDNGGGFSLISVCVSLLLMFWLGSSEEMYWFQNIINGKNINTNKWTIIAKLECMLEGIIWAIHLIHDWWNNCNVICKMITWQNSTIKVSITKILLIYKIWPNSCDSTRGHPSNYVWTIASAERMTSSWNTWLQSSFVLVCFSNYWTFCVYVVFTVATCAVCSLNCISCNVMFVHLFDTWINVFSLDYKLYSQEKLSNHKCFMQMCDVDDQNVVKLDHMLCGTVNLLALFVPKLRIWPV